VKWTTVVVGSEGVLADFLERAAAPGELADSDIVIVPTAAAFSGATEAAVRVAALIEGLSARIEALMVTDRTSATEEYFAARIRAARVVVLVDGAALHARSTWRDTAVGEALRDARTLVAIGTVATVIGAEMVDPRGGAPTTGLALREGAVITTPASDDQLARTRDLVEALALMIVVDAEGAVVESGGAWRQLSPSGVHATRGHDEVRLARAD